MRFPCIFSFLATLLLTNTDARADCPLLQEVLSERGDDVVAFSAKNAAMMASVIEAENSCKEQGAKISAKIAKSAESLTCQAQADAAEMNQEMERIGLTCTQAFQKRHEMQTLLHIDFNQLLADVDEGADFIVKSEILNVSCGDEVKMAKKLYTASHVTEGNIVATELHALSAMNSYEKFRATSEEFKKQTLARNQACGLQELPSLGPIPAGAPGIGAPPMIAGVSPRDASQITGKINNQKLDSLEARKIDRMKFPNDTEFKVDRVAVKKGSSEITSNPNRPSSGTGDALATYTKQALLPVKLAKSSPAPTSALDSAVLLAWQATEQPKGAADSVGTLPAATAANLPESEESGRAPASLSEVPAIEKKEGVQFVGEIGADGSVVLTGSAPSSSMDESLFGRVGRVYRKHEKHLETQKPAPVAMAMH